MKIGIFGGSFDPVHFGHLILAEQCRQAADLEQVWFVPAANQPLKPSGPVVDGKKRLEMLTLALAGNAQFVVSPLEVDRGNTSYTVDTLTEIKRLRPEYELYFLMGSDSLESFHLWKNPQEICRLAMPLVVGRPGAELDMTVFEQFTDTERLQTIFQHQVESPLIEISSTRLRSDISRGRSIRYQLPRSVEKYIESRKLYLDPK